MTTKAPVHPKVKAATAGAGAGTVLAAAVEQVVESVFYGGHTEPAAITALIFLAVPAAAAFLAGYAKKSGL